eukprot:FR735589.1.p4 GENE.FR735589.1~~FR735589.1.p4  ORF type:complete len:102 (+),score=46.40 FR735589.1:981-1286(+)
MKGNKPQFNFVLAPPGPPFPHPEKTLSGAPSLFIKNSPKPPGEKKGVFALFWGGLFSPSPPPPHIKPPLPPSGLFFPCGGAGEGGYITPPLPLKKEGGVIN